ncbi:MAG: DUF1512 family protein [Promethearchaeota archaeon]
MILQTTSNNDPISLILNLLFFILIFASMFYGTKIQAFKSQKAIEAALEELKKWNNETKTLTVKKIKKMADDNLTIKDIESKMEELINFIMINPVSLDPYGIIPKLDHLMDVREQTYMKEVRALANKADETQLHNIENLLEAAMAVDQIYRILLHYLLIGKKTKSYIILMQVEMQLSLISGMAKTYKLAAEAFAEGSPIGDALGPMVAASFVRLANNNRPIEYEQIAYETILQETNFEGRKIYVIRAKGPGGTVGKPGEAIKTLIDRYGDQIKRVIMVDAGLKMEGDKTGSVVTGIGAAIGGVGVEKFKIEESSTNRKIPVDAIICRQSLEDAICTMRKPVTKSVAIILDKIKDIIRKSTQEGDSLILAGIGNTIGIGV